MKRKIISIYTDGACSKNPGVGGWGVVMCLPKEIKLFAHGNLLTTNNRMELQAVIEAVKIVKKDKSVIPGSNIVIHSDSAYVVNAINQKWIIDWERLGWKTKSGSVPKNLDLWLELKDQFDSYEGAITIKKVKGHSDDTLNDLADKLATGVVAILKGVEEIDESVERTIEEFVELC